MTEEEYYQRNGGIKKEKNVLDHHIPVRQLCDREGDKKREDVFMYIQVCVCVC